MDGNILDYFDDEIFDDKVRIVAVKYFYFESEAHLYAARLREADIPFFISNANAITALPLGEGGIGLHVRDIDLAKASSIVAQLDNLQRGDEDDQSFHEADLEDIQYQEMLHRNNTRWFNGISLLILLLILLIVLRTYLRAAGIVESWWDFF